MADVIKLPSIPDQPVGVAKDEKFPEEQQNEVPPSQPPNPQSQSNSHPHDSEYDTASDLEGGDEDDYDDEDDEDESLGADGEEEDIDSENDSMVFDLERQRGDGQETDYAKKVDEDRSNPQYIPKKGTFYEHDDRTADDDERGENRPEEGGDGDTTKSSTPTISAGTKTMKKWQPASAVDRWSHDRYDESEQAPKSRAELVSAYGYDIRNEDGPPRARRRRRYGRGPTKYVRNWEDENAYIKATNPQRKPRPEDFPALGDKKRKTRSFREEKENRYERQGERGPHRMSGGGAPPPRDGKLERRSSGKTFRSGGRQSLDFKNQSKVRSMNDSSRNPLGRTSEKNDGMRSLDDGKSQVESVSFTNTSVGPSGQSDRYNGHEAVHHNQMPGHRDLKDKMSNLNSSSHLNNRQSTQTSQLASRLQIQRGNDPLHVGSVQMHSLVTQNQSDIQQPGGESGKTKRYSSLRQRSQNDSGVPTQNTQIDQHNLQQMQLHDHHQPQPQQQQQQQQQPQQQQAQHVLMPEQHLLQANLMQLYHTQDNLQMQSVAIQSLPAGHQAKPQFQNVQQQYQPPAQSTPAAYYASVNEYPTAPANPPAPQPQYSQQQPAAYIQPPPPANQQIAAFNAQSPPPGPPVTQPIPTALNYVQPQSAATNPPYQNYSGYHQNFNTVGGTTYFVPQQAPPPRPVVIAQRRPTNAIPILAPPTDKAKKALGEKDDENKAMPSSNAPIGSAENIDHILDNMFVQRPPYQPPTTRKSSSPATESVGTSTSNTSEDKPASVPAVTAPATSEPLAQARLEESIKNLSISEEPIPLPAPTEQPPTSLPPAAAPSEVVQNETG